MENDFYEQVGYELPPDAPRDTVSEGTEYYKHPAGIYVGFVGRLITKYKDVNDKACVAGVAGAKFSHYQLVRWIQRYLGTPAEPLLKDVLGNDLQVPDVKFPELYFGEYLSAESKDQWSIAKKFENFKIAGYPKYDIIQPDSQKPSLKRTIWGAFPAYYGMIIKWEMAIGEKKGNSYVVSTSLVNAERIPTAKILELEQKVADMIERERQQREMNKQQNDNYTPPPPPEADVNSLMSGDSDEWT